ncbi:hypothetical protein MG293_017383 [Ovis ammon polii]|uniref:cAMP-regulated phosphoprotein 21 n=1 Tax=Ovis ammon polii TaxID=230172 RepID=A0AAD4TQI5_OVIAM|nr:hypothetical protein MG293_017383 [Ovis ammon polii]
MSEPGDLSQTIVEEGGPEQETATPENGVIKSESLDEEEKLELQSGAGKGKLTRSLAVCEESSARPGGESLQDQESIHLQLSSFPSLQEEDKSRKDDPEREKEKDKNKDKTSEKPKIRMLSKDCSQEYTDSTGIDLHEFLINTLKNNSRDRMILLKMEQEIIDFIGDNNNHYKKFPQMSSYQRMLVHRVAAYFGLDHNVDQTGKSVIINKTSNTRIPEQRFCEHLKDEKGEESQKRFILKRDNSSIDKEDTQQNRMHPFRDDRRSKSIEEREEEYQRVRERIFAHDSVCSQENLFVENRGNRDGSGRTSGSRQSSSENELKWSDHQRAWSSTDSDSSNRNLKPAMTKTASFGGITVLSRADSTSSSRSTGKLSKAASLADVRVSLDGLQREDVATQFSQMTLSRQSSGETPEPPAGSVYPPSLLPQPTQQPSYVIASTGQQLPTGSFSGSQQVLQPPASPQGFVHQPPPTQMPVYYYPSGQYPTSTTQQYRPMASVQFSAQRSQQIPPTAQPAGIVTAWRVLVKHSGNHITKVSEEMKQQVPNWTSGLLEVPAVKNSYQPVLSGPQGFQGLVGVQQPPQSQGVMSSQQGTPVQSVMVSYPAVSNYQVPMTQGSQGLPQQSYQQPLMLPTQAGQGSLPAAGMPVYCNVTPTTPQNNLRLMGPPCPSSTVPVVSASCRTNCASMSNAGWQVKF